MYNLIKYCDNNLETFVCLWQYSTDGIRNTITNSTSFKYITGFLDNTNSDSIINVEIAVPLKYL